MLGRIPMLRCTRMVRCIPEHDCAHSFGGAFGDLAVHSTRATAPPDGPDRSAIKLPLQVERDFPLCFLTMLPVLPTPSAWMGGLSDCLDQCVRCVRRAAHPRAVGQSGVVGDGLAARGHPRLLAAREARTAWPKCRLWRGRADQACLLVGVYVGPGCSTLSAGAAGPLSRP